MCHVNLYPCGQFQTRFEIYYSQFTYQDLKQVKQKIANYVNILYQSTNRQNKNGIDQVIKTKNMTIYMVIYGVCLWAIVTES